MWNIKCLFHTPSYESTDVQNPRILFSTFIFTHKITHIENAKLVWVIQPHKKEDSFE